MVTLDIFLAHPIITVLELPSVEPERMRFVYSLQLPDSEDEHLLEQAFRILNVNHPADYCERSLSVGDVVTIAGARSYRCDWMGWHKLENPLLPVGNDFPPLIDEIEAQLAVKTTSGVNTELAVELLDWLDESPALPVVVAIPRQGYGAPQWYQSLVTKLKRITARLFQFEF